MKRQGTYAEENWTVTGKEAIKEIDDPTPSCLRCKKNDVCMLYRSEIQMLQSYYGHIEDKSQWPCEPEDRAKTCKKYLPFYLQEIER